MHVLVTGFPPFPHQPINPTQQIVEAIRAQELGFPGIQLSAELLPVEYRGVEQVFQGLLEDLAPDLVLSFGVGRQKSLLRLESIGKNLDDAHLPDNAGEYRAQALILPEGPDEYHSPLDLMSLADTISADGVDVEISQDAGAYVCNHLNYYGMHLSRQSRKPFPFLFTHTSSVENGFHLNAALTGLKGMLHWFSS